MRPAALQSVTQNGEQSTKLRSFFFLVFFFTMWITLTPYVDLSTETAVPEAIRRVSLINYAIYFSIFFIFIYYAVKSPLGKYILAPKLLFLTTTIWFSITCLMSYNPLGSIKSFIFSFITITIANTSLYVPVSKEHLSKLLIIISGTILFFAYFGVFFKPNLAIHQSTDFWEPIHQGLWRGHYFHKNIASGVMVSVCFFGLYAMREGYKISGLLACILSTYFLLQTGGKTSSAMLPLVIILSWGFIKFRFMRIPISVIGIMIFNFLTVGAANIDSLYEALESAGIDASFTHRDDIWRLSFSAIAERPIFGYGLKGFWQSPDLLKTADPLGTWAITIASNAHNAYVDLFISAGIPGFILTMIWVLFFPLRSFSQISSKQLASPLTALYTRIWLYGLYGGVLENSFYTGAHPMWFSFIFAIYGLQLQAKAEPVSTIEMRHQDGIGHVKSHAKNK